CATTLSIAIRSFIVDKLLFLSPIWLYCVAFVQTNTSDGKKGGNCLTYNAQKVICAPRGADKQKQRSETQLERVLVVRWPRG
ncbi:hypothetical protein, partial [Candidatus Erwinia dacicola]|uniref:hypothetical protein n=1 Tax=Candidatus Erwinia dacicola TaxID=252393 RepID=UPI001C9BCBC9